MKLRPSDIRERAKPRKSETVYAIAGVLTRRVKIGRAWNIAQRFAQLQAASPDHLVLMGWADQRGIYEEVIHEMYDHCRLHGEWFGPELTEEIARLVPIPSRYQERCRPFERWVDSVVDRWQVAFAQLRGRPLITAPPERPRVSGPGFVWRGKRRTHTPGGAP